MKEEKKHSILKTVNLDIGYKSKKGSSLIASNINLELNQGELVALVGANGIGKSTFLRTITAIQKPLKGEIFLNDAKLSKLSQLELAQIMSLVLTEPLLSKNLSVFELVALGRQPYTNWIGSLTKVDAQIIHKALNDVSISELKDKKCFELSDGQLQKAMLARALAQDTNLIVLDEPTTHLDMYHKAYILKLLQKLAKETQKTILFSSHEMDLAIQLCDKIIVMTKDEVISDEPCNLISNGTFNSLFPKDLITFDSETGRFKVRK